MSREPNWNFDWYRTFAWFPVWLKLDQRWTWLRWVETRKDTIDGDIRDQEWRSEILTK